LGLHAGQHIRVQDAILGLVTESANDAAVVLGEAMGGSEEGFAQLMTRQAHALGMNQTVFHNPSGLPDPDQVTTAHDMAVLGDALVNHFPQFYPYFSHESFTYAGIYHHNHNHLMDRYDGMDGIKTGYIRASGFNLVASAKRNGVRLIGVVFGGHSAVARDNHMAQLLDACFPIAIAERSSGQVKQAEAQGDSGDGEKDDTIALPAKVAAIFPGRGLTDTVAPTRAVTAAPAQTSTSVETVVAVSQPQANTTPAVNSDAVQTARDATFPATISRATIPRATVRVEQPTAVRAAVPTGSWGIQIGAYSDAAIGRQALANLMTSMPDQLGKADAQVQPVSSGGIAMYRARLMALDKKTAQSVCS
jgi:D-alanyl-D-alanine carboxypeptidase